MLWRKEGNTRMGKIKKWCRQNSINLFYLPALFIMFFFILVPLLNGFRLSFFKWNGYSQNMKFIWFDNYVKLPDDKYLRLAFLNTLLYGFGSTILQNILGLTAALFVDSRFRGHTFVRTFIYMPIMIANLIMGYIMYYFLQYEGGIINEVMGWFGRAPVDWLSDAGRARIIITLVNSVQYCGNSMVLYLAGLQSIPDIYHEAAKIDGAGTMRRFWTITLPLLIPSITSAVVINLIGSLKLNDIIIALTNAGPAQKTHSLSTYISYVYFRSEKAGFASAIGVFMFMFILVVSLITNRFLQSKEVEY